MAATVHLRTLLARLTTPPPSTSSAPFLSLHRGLAAKGSAAGKKGGKGSAVTAEKGQMATEVAVGLAVRKGGTDPRLSKDRKDYPDWLWHATTAGASLEQLKKKVDTDGIDAITEQEYMRFKKLRNRRKIKDRNEGL